MDAVAYFLFEERAGYCEHFASALTVMARSLGIPARLVTGYTGGSFNPFTGLWEVRENDAHAWVEIYFGAAGWVPFDPTPGFNFPSGEGGEQDTWRGGALLAFLENTLGRSPLGDSLRALGRSAGQTLAWLVSLPWALLMATLGALALSLATAAYSAKRIWQLWRRRRLLAASLGPDYRREPLLKDYYALAVRLKRYGIARRPEETLSSFAGRVGEMLGGDEFQQFSQMVEERRYGNLSRKAASQESWRPLVAGTLAHLQSWQRQR